MIKYKNINWWWCGSFKNRPLWGGRPLSPDFFLPYQKLISKELFWTGEVRLCPLGLLTFSPTFLWHFLPSHFDFLPPPLTSPGSPRMSFSLHVWKVSEFFELVNAPDLLLGKNLRCDLLSRQAFWYYTMVQFPTIDLKSHPIAQFMKNCIIHKRTHKIHKIKHKSTSFFGIPA